MCELGFFIGSWGNVGVRVAEGMLITPTRLDYDRMQPQDIVLMSWDGRRLGGERLPSSEMHLHRLVLQARPDLGAVVHSHPSWASVVAALHRSLPIVMEDMAQIIGAEVQCSRYVRAGRHMELAQQAVEAMGKSSMAALLANHGLVVGGRDLKEATVATRIVEKAAMIFVLGKAVGTLRPIPADQAAQERDRYQFKYGTAADQPMEADS
jgi:L-fuculose-phosphate aldolase